MQSLIPLLQLQRNQSIRFFGLEMGTYSRETGSESKVWEVERQRTAARSDTGYTTLGVFQRK